MLRNEKQRELIERLKAKRTGRHAPEELRLGDKGFLSNEWNLRSGAHGVKH